MADYMVGYCMKKYESKYIAGHSSRNQNWNPRSVYIVLSYLEGNCGLFAIELDEKCSIWGGDAAKLSVRPPRLKKIQDLVGEYNSSNSIITGVFGIYHEDELYVLRTSAGSEVLYQNFAAPIEDWIPGVPSSYRIKQNHVPKEEGYIYGIPKFGSKTGPLKLIKSFEGPKASKPSAIVMSAYGKFYVLEPEPHWDDWNPDSFERYDPISNTWELLQPPLSHYSMFWTDETNSLITGYVVYDQLIILCLNTCESLEANFMVYNIYLGEWVIVRAWDSFPCWEKKALIIDGIAYAVTVEGKVIEFTILTIGATIELTMLNLFHETNTDIPLFGVYNTSQCLAYLGNKEFFLVQSFYDCNEDYYHEDDEDEEDTDSRQPLFITTLRVVGNKILILDTKVFVVSIKEQNTFLLDICFTPGCEVKDPEDSTFEWLGPMLEIFLKVIVGDTSENATSGEIVEFSEDNDVSISLPKILYSNEAAHQTIVRISVESFKGWCSWALRDSLRMMGKVAIPLIAIGLTWMQVSKKNWINRAGCFEKEMEQSSKIL